MSRANRSEDQGTRRRQRRPSHTHSDDLLGKGQKRGPKKHHGLGGSEPESNESCPPVERAGRARWMQRESEPELHGICP